MLQPGPRRQSIQWRRGAIHERDQLAGEFGQRLKPRGIAGSEQLARIGIRAIGDVLYFAAWLITAGIFYYCVGWGGSTVDVVAGIILSMLVAVSLAYPIYFVMAFIQSVEHEPHLW